MAPDLHPELAAPAGGERPGLRIRRPGRQRCGIDAPADRLVEAAIDSAWLDGPDRCRDRHDRGGHARDHARSPDDEAAGCRDAQAARRHAGTRRSDLASPGRADASPGRDVGAHRQPDGSADPGAHRATATADRGTDPAADPGTDAGTDTVADPTG